MPLPPSAPAHRVVDVVVTLASNPGIDFSVSELARAAGVNRTTCQSILFALAERGWVQHREDTGWRLGAGLVPIGDAALASLEVVDEAQTELDALVAELGLEALASVTAGSDIVIVAHAHSGRLLTDTVRLGQSIPFVPPFGIAHLAHAGEDAFDAWVARATAPLSQAEQRMYRAAVHAAETQGYVVVLDAEARRRFEADIAELARRPASRAARRSRDEMVARLERESAAFGLHNGSGVSQISAAVFGPSGRPVLAIGLHAQPHQIEPERIAELGARVAAAAATITTRTSGRPPHPNET